MLKMNTVRVCISLCVFFPGRFSTLNMIDGCLVPINNLFKYFSLFFVHAHFFNHRVFLLHWSASSHRFVGIWRTEKWNKCQGINFVEMLNNFCIAMVDTSAFGAQQCEWTGNILIKQVLGRKQHKNNWWHNFLKLKELSFCYRAIVFHLL